MKKIGKLKFFPPEETFKKAEKRLLGDSYKAVIKDLERGAQCKEKDYTIGCYSCGVRFLIKNLKSYYEMMYDSEPVSTKKEKRVVKL